MDAHVTPCSLWLRWQPFLCLSFLYILSITGAAIVTTHNGDIAGTSVNIRGVTVDIYLGVPFAKPPIGDLRFKAPQPVQNWTGVLDVTNQPNSCIQSLDTSFGNFEGVDMWNTKTNISEDCLYLNLWVPRTSGKDRLATMVWIYGGSFVYGSITLDIYDGSQLAASGNVMVASMQYRMSVHGFLYLGTEDAPGNMGLLDQQMAMRWLHENVDIFGGDKTMINLFGESAGAASIGHHLLASSSWPYFNNAIMQSSTSLSHWATVSPEYLLKKSKTIATLLGCNSQYMTKIAECLRMKDTWDLENKQWELDNDYVGTFNPTVDGKFLTDYPQNLINSGKYKDADILLGNTKDEGEYFLLYFYPTVYTPDSIWSTPSFNRSVYLDTVSQITGFPAQSVERDSVLYIYEYANTRAERGSYSDILDDLLGDMFFKCSVRDVARFHSRESPSKGSTYLYSFEYRNSGNPWPAWMGSLHGYEIDSIFAVPLRQGSTYTDTDKQVSDMTMAYFTNFAKTGNPNSDGLPNWPKFSEYTESYIRISGGPETTIMQGFRNRECTFWEYLAPKIKYSTGSSSTSVSGSDVTTAASSFAIITSFCAAILLHRYVCTS